MQEIKKCEILATAELKIEGLLPSQRTSVVKYFSSLFLLFSILAKEALPSENCSDLLQQVQSFQFYEVERCHLNILNMIEHLKFKLNNFNLDHAQVIFITPIEGKKTIRAYFTKNGVKDWRYHVILSYEGRVIDPDFYEQNSLPLLSKYYQKMFLPPERELKNSVLHEVEVLTLSALEYRQDYRKFKEGIYRDASFYVSPTLKDQREPLALAAESRHKSFHQK